MNSVQVLVNAALIAEVTIDSTNHQDNDLRAECERIYDALNSIGFDISAGEYDSELRHYLRGIKS